LPKSLDGIKTILFYPVFGLIITGLLMLVINIPMKAINDALNHFLPPSATVLANVAVPKT
jgi:PTS system fructose-specific IIC component